MEENIINDLTENVLSQLAVYEEKLQTIQEKVETRLKDLDEETSLKFQALKEQARVVTDQAEVFKPFTEIRSNAEPIEGQTNPESEEARSEDELNTENPKEETNQDTLESLNELGLEAVKDIREEDLEEGSRADESTSPGEEVTTRETIEETDLDEAALQQEPGKGRDNSPSSAEPL